GAAIYNGAVTLLSDVDIDTDTGDVTFNNTLNSVATETNSLVVNTAGTTRFNGAVGGVDQLASLTTNAGGTTDLNGGTVQTTGTQTYHDSVVLSADTSLTASTATFNGTLSGLFGGNNYSLAITGQAVFGDAAADTVTGLTTLLVSGTTAINTHMVSSSGTQTYSGNVTIGASAGT